MARRKVACLLGDGFEDSELRKPYDRLRDAGFDVIVVGAQRGQQLRGYKGKEAIKVDLSIDDARPEDFDAVLIPGGHSPDHLRADARFVDFVRAFDRSKRIIAAVCHGPQLLITAGLVKGRTLTAWSTVQEDLRQIGANVVDQEVVEQGNWITSRKPDDLDAFADAILRALGHGMPATLGDAPAPPPAP